MKKMQLLVVIALVGFISACSKLTQANYQQLKMGMSQQEIEAIIGGSDKCEDNLVGKTCLWGKESAAYIKVNFVSGNAVMFQHDKLKP